LAFLGAGWVKAWVKINLDSRAFGGQYLTSKSAVFWKTGLDFDLFSTRTETGHFTGISGRGRDPKSGKGAQFGLIFPLPWYYLYTGYPRRAW
jgi:hypothetical protein